MKKTFNFSIIILSVLVLSFSVYGVGTGGTITTSGTDYIHTFTTNGTFNWTGADINVSILICAGGGGGGQNAGGGGGAGDLIFYNQNYSITAGVNNITIGTFGIGALGGSGFSGGNGSSSKFNSITAIGGGGGGGGSGDKPPWSGGSGGGAGGSTNTANGIGAVSYGRTGNAGGNGDQHHDITDYYSSGGGGGGANNTGQTGVWKSLSGKGGGGLNFSISGTNTCYSAGGGGGRYSSAVVPTRGLGGTCLGGTETGGDGNNANDGGRNATAYCSGGGGEGYGSGTLGGGNGTQGIIIIRYGTSSSSANATFLSQKPSDLNTSNIFSKLNITYSFNTTGLSNVFLNLSIVDSTRSCVIYTNKTCSLANNTPTFFYDTSLAQNVSFLLDDNEFIPATYKYDEGSFDNASLSFLTLSSINDLAVFREYNINTGIAFNFEEIGLNTSATGVCNIYFANNTNDRLSNLLSSGSATLLTSLTKQDFNHCHEGGGTTHCDNIIPISIINNKINNVTPIVNNDSGYFIVKPQTAGTSCYIQYAGSLSGNSGDTRTSNSAGVVYTNQTYVVRSHLHQFGSSTNTRVVYDACANYSGAISCSGTFRTDYFDISPLPPSSPNFFTPYESQNVTEFLTVNCSDSSSPQGTAIANYTFYLLNSDLSINRTLGVNTTKCYINNNTYNSLNLSIAQYSVLVIVSDTSGLTSNSTSSLFYHSKNMKLNVTVYDLLTLANLTNFSINFIDTSTLTNETFSSSGGNLSADLIKGHTYNLTVSATGYASTLHQYTTTSNAYQNTSLSISKENSVQIYIRDSTTLALINTQTTNITFTSNLTAYNYSTADGTLFAYNLTAGVYEVKFNSLNYAENTYFVTISNGSTQTLNAYMTSSGTDVIFTLKGDLSSLVLEGATVQVSKIVNGSWTVIDTKFTDITGRTKFNLLFTTNYRFSCSFTGYDDKVFNLNPVLFTSYDVFMTPIDTPNPNEMDFSDISIQWTPNSFSGNNSNTFIWEIRSPTGKLMTYFFNLSYPCGSQNFSGVSATGDMTSKIFNITCATPSDSTAILLYGYTTSLGDSKSYTSSIGISVKSSSNYTLMQNEENTFGMGTFERVLIVTIVVIVIAGVGAMFGGLAFGTFFGLLIYGFFAYQGFIPIWSVILPIIIGFFIIKESTGR